MIKNKLPILAVLITICLIYLKPIYSLIFIFFFSENIFFIIYVMKIYENYENYYKIEIKEINLWEKNMIEIWIEYLRIQAFKKIYFMLSKKQKIKINEVLITFVIILLEMPIRFIKILYKLMSSKKKRKNLEILYTYEYWEIKNWKIEIFEKKIYLNCFTINKLIRKILNISQSKQKTFNIIYDIKKTCLQYDAFEKKENKHIEMVLGKIRHEGGIVSEHFLIQENKTTIHATSNGAIILTKNQEKDIPISFLIKPGAREPASIITKNIELIINKNKFIIVPKREIEYIKYSHLKIFDLNTADWEYQSEKENNIKEMLKNEGIKDILLEKEIIGNCYTQILKNLSNSDIINIIENISDQ